MPWGRQVRKLCRAAAEAGSPGASTPLVGEAWCLQGLGSGQSSPVGPQQALTGGSGTEFLGGIPLSLEEEVEEGSWAGCPVQEACWGAGARWDLVGPVGREEAAWPGGQSHRALREDEEEEGS